MGFIGCEPLKIENLVFHHCIDDRMVKPVNEPNFLICDLSYLEETVLRHRLS